MSIEAAAQALVTRMEEIYAHPDWCAVWEARQLMCGTWMAPQWEAEFVALKEELARLRTNGGG